uniref:Uncharacterized protein n=1 Tax=Caenorhabditis japonica TaxID=281687 RepID=A0A8R1ECD5_CAEJA
MKKTTGSEKLSSIPHCSKSEYPCKKSAFESQRKEKQRQQRVAAQKHSAFSDEEDEQGNNENQEETEA